MLYIYISVVILIYNTDRYLERNINSAIKQILEDVEINFVNDGSIDNSQEVLEVFEILDSRIKVISLDISIEVVMGKFIGFIDKIMIINIAKFYITILKYMILSNISFVNLFLI